MGVLLYVLDMSECLQIKARFPDPLICAISALFTGTPVEDSQSVPEKWHVDVVRVSARWEPGQDVELMQLAWNIARSRATRLLDLDPSVIVLDTQMELSFPALRGVPVEDIRLRFATLKL